MVFAGLACLAGAASAWSGGGDLVPAPDPVGEYLDAIERVEGARNAYSPELADLYLGLGQALLEREDYEDARTALLQGTHILRINHGLDSPEQTDYLFSIADIEHRLGDWDSAQKALHQIETITNSWHGADEPESLPVLEQVLAWYQRHRPLQSPQSRYEDMQRFEVLARRMAAISEREKGLAHPDTAAIYRTLGQIQYATVKYVTGKGVSVEPGLMMATGSLPAGPNVELVYIRSHYKAGTEAFSKVVRSVAANEDSTALEHAEALAQLGDWYLVFEKNKVAHRTLRQAHRVLAQSAGTQVAADAYFGDPVPVRFMDDPPHTAESGKDGDPGPGLEVSMDVTALGRPQNIVVLNPPGNMGKARLRRIVHMVREMRFRPRLSNGVPEKAEQFVWVYHPGHPHSVNRP